MGVGELTSLLDGGEHLDLIVATSQVGLWELDVKTGHALRNLRHDQIFGHRTMLPSWSAEIFLGYVIPEDRERVGNTLTAAVEEGTQWAFETQIVRIDGQRRWISASGTPRFGPDGQMEKLIGHVIDITDLKDKEERLELLSKELSHRVGNNLTILNAMVRHGRQTAQSVDEFAETLMWRLAALSRSNRVLLAADAERANFATIVQLELDAFDAGQNRVAVTGDTSVWFSPQASEGLALVLHELSTNAMKYGALSVPDGRVVLSIGPRPGGQTLIKWTESGGPKVTPPSHKGIGTNILSKAMRDNGTVTMTYAPEGLICEVLINESFRNTVGGKVSRGKVIEKLVRVAAAPTDILSGKRIMVVEDDPIISFDLTELFQERGMDVVGPFSTTAGALAGIETLPDLAVMDINLGEGSSEDVARRARELGVPFCIISGDLDNARLAGGFANADVVLKPYRIEDVLHAAMRALDQSIKR